MKNKLLICGGIAILSAMLTYGQGARTTPASALQSAVAGQKAVLDQYCVTCHNDNAKMGGLSLQAIDLTKVPANAETLEKVVRKLRAGVMPPPGQARPQPAAYEALTVWLENELDRTASSQPNPGTVGLHRLNRNEYANAIRDLLDIDIDVETTLPADDSSNGFDNMAGTLGISPALLNAYVSAARKISHYALGNWTTPTEARYIPPGDTSQRYHIDGLPIGTRGGMKIRHTFPADGEYEIFIQSLNNGVFVPGEKLEVLVNGELAHLFDYDAQTQENDLGRGEQHMSLKIPVRAGTHDLGITFLERINRPSLDLNKHFERDSLDNYNVDGFTFPANIGYVLIRGPYNPVGAQELPSYKKIFVCKPASAAEEAACARQILSNLARQAYRRPATPEDMEGLLDFYDEGRRTGDFDDGIELALRRILASPQFIFRMEAEPANVAAGQVYKINDLEFASRLSFFLWSSNPDDELITLANQNKLRDPAVLDRQVRRMLADPKSHAMVENFASQWLYLRNLPATAPSQVKFPDWDDNLRQAFRTETEMLFESIIREDRNLLDLLTADYTFVNERLAKHYGIPGVYGSRFQRVTLGPEFAARRGLLGQGSILSVTSQPDRTSPVKRGVWILENILGSRPPNPPAVVPPLEKTKGEVAGKVLSLRERMQEHRAVQPCSGCHRIMDPIGFSLENFDATGRWRVKDGDSAIDGSGELYDGSTVSDPISLRQALLRYSPQYYRNVTEKLMTYAIGRGAEFYDMPVIRTIVRDAGRDNYKFSAVVLGIVKSAPFQMKVKSAQTAQR